MIKFNLSYKKLLRLNKLFKNKIIIMSKLDRTQSMSFDKLLKSFYLTCFASLIIISFFAITPKIIEIKNILDLNNYEAENKSKLIFLSFTKLSSSFVFLNLYFFKSSLFSLNVYTKLILRSV